MADVPLPKGFFDDDTTGYQPRVFISYARRDADVATRLSRLCEKQGLETWVDRVDLREGEDWWVQTEEAIKESNVFIVLLSDSFGAKEWPQREWSSICERLWENPKVRVIPVRLEAIDVPAFLRSRYCLDVHDSADLNRCVKDIRRISFGSRAYQCSEENAEELRRKLADRFRVVLGVLEKYEGSTFDVESGNAAEPKE